MIKGVHSVVIWTDDTGRLVPFYRDVLGLKLEEMGGFAVLDAGSGPQIGIGEHSEVRGPSKDPNRVMLDLAVEDCQGEYDRLAARGVKFVRKPEQDGNVIIATLQDPDGNMLQLFQEV